MSFSTQKGTKTTSVPSPVYLPGQAEYITSFLEPFKQVFAGDYTAPVIQTLMRAMEEAGMREAARERYRITRSPMSTPARQRALAGVGEGAISAAAQVPQAMSQRAMDVLQQYSLTPPQVGQYTRSSGGGGMGFGLCGSCYIFKAFNEGYLEPYVRLYRDTHYPKGGLVDKGYRWMSNWLVPAMDKYPFLKHIVRLLMIYPLSQYARWYYGKNKYGFVFTPARYFWPNVWNIIGREVR